MNDFEAKFFKKIMRSRKAEALEWLLAEMPNSMRSLGELKHARAVALVRRIYELGVVEVIAAQIQNLAQGQSSNSLILELPTDPDARRRIFKLDQKMAQVEGYDGNADDGQQLLFVKLKSDDVVEAVFGRGGDTDEND